jgi:hypothetical protein
MHLLAFRDTELSHLGMAIMNYRSTISRAIAIFLACLIFAHVEAYTPVFPKKGGAPPVTEALADATKASSRRRDLLLQTQGIILASLLVGTDSIPSHAQDLAPPSKMTIVVTGSNSGLGFEACKRLATQGHNLVLACRTANKARLTAERIQETTNVSGNLIPMACDLADMSSIKSFTENLPGLIGNARIDTLCLNAGLSRNIDARDCARTKDGFELTGSFIITV